jgi:diketogulonate reductase-like aldo/keto reductase
MLSSRKVLLREFAKTLDDRVIAVIAKHINKTPAQVLLACEMQRGTATLTQLNPQH